MRRYNIYNENDVAYDITHRPDEQRVYNRYGRYIGTVEEVKRRRANRLLMMGAYQRRVPSAHVRAYLHHLQPDLSEALMDNLMYDIDREMVDAVRWQRLQDKLDRADQKHGRTPKRKR